MLYEKDASVMRPAVHLAKVVSSTSQRAQFNDSGYDNIGDVITQHAVTLVVSGVTDIMTITKGMGTTATLPTSATTTSR